MIEPTDEMVQAYRNARTQRARQASYNDPVVPGDMVRAGLAAVLAIIEREHVILPRGAQALCCDDHPEAVIRWGECPVCVAQMPPEERT